MNLAIPEDWAACKESPDFVSVQNHVLGKLRVWTSQMGTPDRKGVNLVLDRLLREARTSSIELALGPEVIHEREAALRVFLEGYVRTGKGMGRKKPKAYYGLLDLSKNFAYFMGGISSAQYRAILDYVYAYRRTLLTLNIFQHSREQTTVASQVALVDRLCSLEAAYEEHVVDLMNARNHECE